MSRLARAALTVLLCACGPGLEEGPPPLDGGAGDVRPEGARREGATTEAAPCLCASNYDHYQAHRLYYCAPPQNTRLCAAGSNEELPGLLNLYDQNCLREITPGYFRKC